MIIQNFVEYSDTYFGTKSNFSYRRTRLV